MVWVSTYDATASPTVRTLWSAGASNLTQGRLVHVANSLSDLDGDGKLAVTVSQFDGSAWTTYVYDAATGTPLATLPAHQLVAILDLDGAGKPALLTADQGTPQLVATRFTRGMQTPLVRQWQLTGG